MDERNYKWRVDCIFRYGGMYVNEKGGGFPIRDGIEVIESRIKTCLLFPEYSKKDITIKRWEGGVHYYATIGNHTVIDAEGNQKWNTPEMAQRAAESFLLKL